MHTVGAEFYDVKIVKNHDFSKNFKYQKITVENDNRCYIMSKWNCIQDELHMQSLIVMRNHYVKPKYVCYIRR